MIRPITRPPVPKNEPIPMNRAPSPASTSTVFTPFLNMPARVDRVPECELSARCGRSCGLQLLGVDGTGHGVVVGDEPVGDEVVQPRLEGAHALGAAGRKDVADLVGLAL